MNMLRYFLRLKLNNIVVILFIFFIIFIYKNLLTNKHSIQFSNTSIRFRTHDFHFYEQSRSKIEYQRIQIDNIPQNMFQNSLINYNKTIESTSKLIYSIDHFRTESYPILWLDEFGDVHWNKAAQNEMLNYLLEKQYPNDDLLTCLTRQLFVLEQWSMGFFSRYHCFIEHFGQTLYSPSMALLLPRRFIVSHSSNEDFRNEGILRYYQSQSLCYSYINHPDLVNLHQQLSSIESQSMNKKKLINNIQDLLERDETIVQFKYSREIWKFGYDHVPHRRWLFDRNRKQFSQTQLTYSSSIQFLIDHSNEHIYYPENSKLNLTNWMPRNSPQGQPKEVLPGTSVNLTITDQIFTSFLRYMFLLFFSPLAPRIQTSTKLLAHHWSEYLSDKTNQPYEDVLLNMAVIFIRRGDKMPEDSFWRIHHRWRNISMYVKGIIDREKSKQIKYKSIFVVTDDASVMNSIQEYARDGLTSSNKDELYARQHLHNRQILYNVFAPQTCFDPFIRIGFDQFLVNVQFVCDYASLVIGHTDSNVGRYLEEIIYVNRQLKENIQTQTYVINAPDTLD